MISKGVIVVLMCSLLLFITKVKILNRHETVQLLFNLTDLGSFTVPKIAMGGEKICRLREDSRLPSLLPRELMIPLSGYYCYSYTNIYRLNFRYKFKLHHYDNKTAIPYTQVKDTKINKTVTFWYDYRDETALDYIKLSFKTDHFFNLWKECCQEAVDCCDNSMTEENIYPTEEYPCPSIWDGWSCFGAAKADTVEKILCSKQAYSTDSSVCELWSEKECFKNGTWNQKTNYDVCAIAPVLRNRHNFNVIVLAVVTVLCFPSVIIFFVFRAFRTKIRYILHRNLILVIIIRNILTIMAKELIILDALKSSADSNQVMNDNGMACRALAFFENAAKNGMYACMLAESFYLHKLIVRAFADEPKLMHLYTLVTVLSFLPSLIWATARACHEGTDCWMVDETKDQWIPDGFRIVILAINFLFLIDIIRVMTLKLKHNSTSRQTKATLRATLFLIPLFGVHILLITNRSIVPDNTCQAEDIYYYISYLIEGLQGVMVSLLFCYMSSEVTGELKNAIRKSMLSLEQRYRFTFKRKSNNKRRTTAATFVE